MLKKTVTYEDFDGNQRTDDFYFNLTKAELTEMELSLNGGLSQLLSKIIQEKDQAQIIAYFKEIVLKAFGEKSIDGKHFIKNDQIREQFACSAAYSDIFMELATDDIKAAEFINGIMPKDVEEAIKNQSQTYTALPGKAPVDAPTPN